MRKLIVRLPANRDFEGVLRLEDANGRVLAGPFAVCGRADDAAARRHGNGSRHPHLPFGDTPLGSYRLAAILPTGKRTNLPADRFGPHGVIVLAPTAGDAALADANGRFYIVIQGGKLSPERRLRPTSGSLRVADKDQKRLVRALRRSLHCVCECVSTSEPLTERPVGRTAAQEESDPPLASAGINLAQLVAAGRLRDEEILGESGRKRHFGPPRFHLFADAGGSGGGGGDSGYPGDGTSEQPTISTTTTPIPDAGFEVSTSGGTVHVDVSADPERDSQINTAVSYLQKNAAANYTGKCATSVGESIRQSIPALQHIGGEHGYAKDMGPKLEQVGFYTVPNNADRQVGDVAVIQSSGKNDPAGHVAMWDGKQWISDTQQGKYQQPNLPYPNQQYRTAKTPYVVYRWPPSGKK